MVQAPGNPERSLKSELHRRIMYIKDGTNNQMLFMIVASLKKEPFNAARTLDMV